MVNHRLVVCEKPSVGASVSSVLNAKECGTGFVYGNGYIVTWVFGHLLKLADADVYDERYKPWKLDDLPIIPEKWQYTASPDKKEQLKIIAELMKRSDVDEIICATDAGREGELIFRELYNYNKCRKPLKRLWVSSLEESAIIAGFKNLRGGSEYDNLYKSAFCRQTADWLVGVNLTRAFSKLYGAKLNVGRVQTPTLALIVEREKQIADFIKEPFYTVEIDCGEFTAVSEKVKDKPIAENIRALSNGKAAKVISVERQKKFAKPPLLYDLTTLQRDANRMYGLTSQQTLDISQKLYELKYISYPRSDSKYLTDDMATVLPGLIDDVAEQLRIENTNIVDISRVIDNSKITDHHAIIPTHTMTVADLSGLSGNERKVLEMISLRLICAVSENHVYNETTVTVDCANNIFTAKWRTVINNGWKSLIKNDLESNEKTLPELSQGYELSNVSAKLNEGFTSPPKHFTEDTLLAAMENAGDFSDTPDARRGLGTSATRSRTIENLIKYRFIERQDKNLLSTVIGMNLIKILPDVMKSAELTANWEYMLGKIEKGDLSDVDFMSEIVEFTRDIVQSNKTANPEYSGLFSSENSLNSKFTAVGSCPRCGKTVREYYKSFACENRECGFTINKNDRFFTSAKKELTAKIISEILKNGKVKINGMYSAKKNKTYDAFVVLKDTGGAFVNFEYEKKNIK